MAPPRRDDQLPRCRACNRPATIGEFCAACDADDWGEADYPYQDRESCWHCTGAGGWHDCGEDCCACLRPELNETCPECDGRGWL